MVKLGLKTQNISHKHRSCSPEVFREKDILKNFAKFT